MACFYTENIYTNSFTPREYQVELIDSAKSRNLVVCLDPSANKTFIVLKVLQELSNDIRTPWALGGKKSLYIGNNDTVEYYAQIFHHLTDLKSRTFLCPTDEIDFANDQILLTTYEICSSWLKLGRLEWDRVNLLIVEDCHHLLSYHPLREVVLTLNDCPKNRPRILGLTIPLFSKSEVEPGCVQAKIKKIESDLNCEVDTANDIVSVLRYNAHPKELIVECGNAAVDDLTKTLEEEVEEVYAFLRDHRYDPSEIYEESFKDEFDDVPDPKKEPAKVLDDFLEILRTMGPWCANKAAFVLLVHVDKLKVRTPYERHYLLLCLVSTVLLRIRAICDHHFAGLSELEKIKRFSTSKILRLVEVVRQFKPRVPSNYMKDTKTDIAESALNVQIGSRNSKESLIDSSDNGTTSVSINSGSTVPGSPPGDDNNVKNGTAVTNGIPDDGKPIDKDSHLPDSRYDVSPDPKESMDCFICGKVNCSGKIKSKQVSQKQDAETGEDENPVDGCSSDKILNGLADKMNGSADLVKDSSISQGEADAIVSAELPNGLSSSKSAAQPENVVPGRGNFPGRAGRWRNRGRGWKHRRGGGTGAGAGGQAPTRPQRFLPIDDADNLCGIIFVHKRFTAKILYHLFHELNKNDEDFKFVSTQYTVGKSADPVKDPREAESEYRKQEDVLKRFRMRECNLVVATSVLEEGIELPRCNLVVRYDPPPDYRSHAHSKGRARQQNSYYVMLMEACQMGEYLKTFATHVCTEEILLGRCASEEPSREEELEAQPYTSLVRPVKPLPGDSDPSVSLSVAIALVNRYCAKLPSDTFTRLAPLWSTNEIIFNSKKMYYTSIRLPINSPVKETIMGYPMPSKLLSKRMAALETCRRLHSRGELDDNLEPIGKESFNFGIEEEDLTPANWDPNVPRPGTTKSRQYYYKRIATCLNDCRPVAGVPCILYNINMMLTCPLPEEQNTRGRKLHPPELASQAFGILTLKAIPKICPFPIFTRSGEVQVSLQECSSSVVLSDRHVETISAFLNFTFTSVLRLQKYLMSFDPKATENSFFIVPTRKNPDSGAYEVDWDFLELIFERRNDSPRVVPEDERKGFVFDPARYQDAVVMPWYRNQDQPQYFYVAEICNHLSPKSSFPGSDYNSFEDYYSKKYGIRIQDTSQPLLDVDHTSARLNFLTPRYVNRKGVALPTSSEETKKAKRENLEQKQILVAELCLVHVVPASLWRQAVCLPCILYRVNALLLADEIRTTVARDIGLGSISLSPDFEWPLLDFGWSLADVLKKSKEENQKKMALLAIENGTISEPEAEVNQIEASKLENAVKDDSLEEKDPETIESKDNEEKVDKSDEDKAEGQEEEGEKDESWMEIGTWTNDMAQTYQNIEGDLPNNLSMVRYGSPTSWPVRTGSCTDMMGYYSDVDSEDESSDFDVSSEASESSSNSEGIGLKITFKGDFLAEAVEAEKPLTMPALEPANGGSWSWNSADVIDELKDDIVQETSVFQDRSAQVLADIQENGMILLQDEKFVVNRFPSTESPPNLRNQEPLPEAESKPDFRFEGYAMPNDICPPVPSTVPQSLAVIPYNPIAEDAVDEAFQGRFSFDVQPDLDGHPGPSPALLLQALTMSNANDGINLERLETIGDSFLKYAITTYLYCTHDNIHEGKLSHLRSKQVSNLKLYRLGQKKDFGESMIASKFEPHDNWLPPCYLVPRDAEQELLNTEPLTSLPYNLVTQHSIPDKSIADCVEALIGAYLIACGPRGALIFMSWLGIKVLPKGELSVGKPKTPNCVVENGIDGHSSEPMKRPVGSEPVDDEGVQIIYGELQAPSSPLLRHVADPEGELLKMVSGFDHLERMLMYSFNDKAYLLQAMTHASYSPNQLTDCYQRLEFLGDAVLDYLITRHLYEDKRAHSPGALTDLRSALVNNTIFASLTVKHGLHKYFRHLSPGLGEVVQRFVMIQEENSHAINEEFYLIGEDAEDVEVPKALGDVFESIAGAIFLDSNMSLDTVWRVYYRMMKKEIEQFSTKVPKSPIRELLELEPETAKFSKPEKLADGRRVRVTVEVFGKGTFKGIGRNYRIAKCTAAKCALKQLKKRGLLARKLSYYNSCPFYPYG
ncbi:dsRNA_bind [Nesidiocoris tenuis]|uniref:DsRNA_bind n=1 Tax=Nesidiocoris tenuis TaxID=355587 RepID=A0ABN7B9X9_9HEMI|nr:dsRNA_bind [Nesidiocoris tenuis]